MMRRMQALSPHPGHPFERSGLAALSDFATPQWRTSFQRLEGDQAGFLEHEAHFRSPEYIWPRDALHTWSRAWEYPYVLHQLEQLRRAAGDAARPRAVDLGSGVTFFPFVAARLGFEVTCIDRDPVCGRDLVRAAERVAHGPGTVEFRLGGDAGLPLETGTVDALFCVSVLEHVADVTGAVREIARVLKPGGALVVTFDLDLRGDHEIGIEGYRTLREVLFEHFELVHPEMTVHPRDMLRSTTGPYPLRAPRGLTAAAFWARQRVLAPLLGRRPAPRIEFLLAVAGFTLRRRG